MDAGAIDAQFHRAVDIVQSLPKGGPVQTTYEEKLWLYSLYKQATEGDIAVARPGLLDMLGRAKWDSWSKQKGKGKIEAKQEYVGALMNILRKYTTPSCLALIAELEAFDPGARLVRRGSASSGSSGTSYHSSQAPISSGSRSRGYAPPPDPSLPIPDVAPDIIPPSALNSSHKSLLSLANAQEHAYTEPEYTMPSLHISASRAHSLTGTGVGGSGGRASPSLHSLRRAHAAPALGFVPLHPRPTPEVIGRDFTPDPNLTPYMPYYHRPGTPSTFSVPPINVPATLQQIQTSLTALHERMATLERSQGALLRRDERARNRWWNWGTEEDELDEAEEAVDRERRGMVARDIKRVRFSVVWAVLGLVRRLMVDLSVGGALMLGAVVLLRGWRGRAAIIRWLRQRLRRLQ